MNYKDLLILKLSGIARWKNNKEIIVPKDIVDRSGHPCTCEFLEVSGGYVLRGYYKNGNIHWQEEYQNGRKSSIFSCWHEDGYFIGRYIE